MSLCVGVAKHYLPLPVGKVGGGGGQGFCGVGSPPTSARGALYPSGSGVVRVECGEHCTHQGSRKCF